MQMTRPKFLRLRVIGDETECPLCRKHFWTRAAVQEINHACPEIVQPGSVREHKRLLKVMGCKPCK